MNVRFKMILTISLAMILNPCTNPDLMGETGDQARQRAESPHASSQLEAATHRGKVITTLDSGGYTYVEFEENGDRIWAAAPRFEVAVGDTISFSSALLMTDFYSRTLEKTFAKIYFINTVQVEGREASQMRDARLPAGHIPIDTNAETELSVEPGSVIKAEGGYTVSECHSLPGETLSGQAVTVRGLVVKFTPHIMGRNWIHIQDGTGNQDTRDLTVTSQAVVRVGDLVLVSGKIFFDKDFGAGYVYPVIIEEATVTVEENGDRR